MRFRVEMECVEWEVWEIKDAQLTFPDPLSFCLCSFFIKLKHLRFIHHFFYKFYNSSNCFIGKIKKTFINIVKFLRSFNIKAYTIN